MFGNLTNGSLRVLAAVNHFMIFSSATIVTGIIGHFLKVYPHQGAHVVYQMVIAAMTMVFWLFGTVLPFINKYRGHLMPMNLIFSYLWLTSFIFAAQSWSGDRCTADGPAFGKCGLKHAVESFNFLAFFFLCSNVITETFLWQAESGATTVATKERPSSGSV